MKRLAIVLGMLLVASGLVYAASDNFTVTVTPTGDRGVIITEGTYNFGNLDTNTSAVSTSEITVTSTGTLTDIEYTIAGDDAAQTWTLETDGVTTPSGQNKVVLQGLFQSSALAPSEATFTSDDTIVTGAGQQVGDASPGEFEGTAEMDNQGLNAVSYLYMRIATPPTSTTESQQTYTVTINAELAD